MYEPRSRTTVPLILLMAVAAMLLCPSAVSDASPSTEISASIVADDEGACLVLSSEAVIPSGTVIVDYTYTVTRTIGDNEVSGASSGEFEQEYVSDGSSHASVRLDFQGNASEHYDAITGAGATFVTGSGTCTATSVPLSLPGIGERTYRFDTSSGQRTVVITSADGLTATVSESDGSIVVDATLSDDIASHYGSFIWFVRDSDNNYLGHVTRTVPTCSWTVSEDDLGDFELGVIFGKPESGWSVDMRTVPISISGTVEKVVSWMYGGEGYALSISYDSSEFVEYSGKSAASYEQRSDFDSVTDFVVVNDVVQGIADDLAASYGSPATGQGFAEFVLAFVQCAFSYGTDDQLYGRDEYYAYPMETIQHMGGDCEDTSILCAALFEAAGYRTGLFLIPSHCIAAVALDSYVAGSVPSAYSSQVAEFSYAYEGRTYYGCETTLDSNLYGVGWISDDYAIDEDGEVWYTYTNIWGRTVTTKYVDVWRSITYRDEGYGFHPVADAAIEIAASEGMSFEATAGTDDDGCSLVLVAATGAPSEDLRLVLFDADGVERTNVSGRSIEPILAAKDFTSIGGSWLSFFDPSSFGLAVGQTDLYRVVGAVSGDVYLELPARHSVSASVEGDGDVLLRSVDVLVGGEVEVLIVAGEGSELRTLIVDGVDRTADAVGWTGSSGSVRDGVLTLTFTMPDHDVAIAAVFASAYSTDVRIALVAEDDGVHLMMVAFDDAVIPSGTISVHYSYVSEQTTPFGRQTVLLEGTVEVPYEADRAYSYVRLDLAGSGHAADIVGAYAVFSGGFVDCRSATVAFTLQGA